ncbi:MAG: AI-2E family transporter [Gammaproteobacteria bacterium]|nr:AI-2E family transporter [Gammaproteobacteria bacterium]
MRRPTHSRSARATHVDPCGDLLLRDWDDMRAAVAEILPGRYREPVVRFAGEVDVQLGRLLRGQLTVMIALAILYTVGLSIAGLALPVGDMTGFLSFIPYLGFFTGLFTASLAVLLRYHDVRHLLFVFAAFGFGEIMENMVLGSRLVGRSIGLHPLLVIFAVLTGGQLFGFAGILLALPVSAVPMVWLRRAHARYRHSAWSE